MNIVRILFLLFSALSASSVNAQTVEIKKMLMKCSAEKVAQLNDYISFMSNKNETKQKRTYYKDKALALFVGKGFSYEENGAEKDGVTIEITQINSGAVSHKLVRQYFDNLINRPSTNIQIKSIEIGNIKISSLQQIDKDTYVCTCQFDEAFIGYHDGKALYKDITTKHVKCYVYAYELEDGIEYIVRLGDMIALHTNRMQVTT